MLQSQLAVTLYTVSEFCKTTREVTETLERIADIGYKAVQLSALGEAVNIKEIARITQELGLTVAATHFGWNSFLFDLDKIIGEHKLYDCKHAAVGGLPETYWNENGLTRFIDEMGEVSEKLNQAGIDFSYHNHSHEFVRYEGKTWLDMLYEQTEPQQLKAEIDVYWIQHGGGNPVEWVRKCAGREPLLHLKDMSIVLPAEQRFAEVGEGNFDWPAILNAAVKGGVKWYIVEQDNCYERNPFDSLAISYNNLTRIFKNL